MPTYFADRYTRDPLILFRIFNYPYSPDRAADQERWGVGEHTDYGVLTILRQDDTGGLQVKSRRRWIDAPPIPGTFVCNIGDMLDRMTRGLYRSTPHRVRQLRPAATGCRFRSSSIRTSTPRCGRSRAGRRRGWPTTARSAGTRPACTS